MGVYIELPKDWAKWSLEVTDVHDNILEAKTTDIDLVRCGECKHWDDEDHWCNIRDSYGWDYKPTDFCSYGEREPMTIEGAIAELQNLINADDVPFYYNGAIQKVIETIIDKCKPNTGRKVYEMPNGKTAIFEYDENGIGKITIEAMDRLMEMTGAKEIDDD